MDSNFSHMMIKEHERGNNSHALSTDCVSGKLLGIFTSTVSCNLKQVYDKSLIINSLCK